MSADMNTDEVARTSPIERNVLKRGNAFLVTDLVGNVLDEWKHGLYLDDTRHLSKYALSIGDVQLRLRSGEATSTYCARTDLIEEAPSGRDPGLDLRRETVLSSHLLERVRIRNLGQRKRAMTLFLSLDVDFKDVFEVRGFVGPRRRVPRIQCGKRDVSWESRGEDGVSRWTRVLCQPQPSTLDQTTAVWNLSLDPERAASIDIKVDFGTGRPAAPTKLASVDSLIRSVEADRERVLEQWTALDVDNQAMASWLARSIGDAVDLIIAVDGHSVPAAGVPWFTTVFGRDSLIFGLETVHLSPHLSMEILRMLAGRQGRRHDSYREEEPGKILHELRRGELAGSGSIPHTPYYGSVDATPLFLCLFSEVFLWTNNLEFCSELYPSAVEAARYIEGLMERGPGGFLSYLGGDPPGLRHQGWKDSDVGVLLPDGSQPHPPLALCEVQGYAYWGMRGLAAISRILGRDEMARHLDVLTSELRDRFDRAFWVPATGAYALALDGSGRQVKTRTSNPGHLLMCGILRRERARRLAKRLTAEDFFSGWGIRTMSESEVPYSPLSYHNGSVWPHDNAVIAWGMSRCGLQEEASMLFEGLLDAAQGFKTFRLPELFAGFVRGRDKRPTRIPQACDLQAWASGAPFLMLRGLLGLEADAPSGKLRVKTFLPPGTGSLRIGPLRVADTLLDILVQGEGMRSEWEIPRMEGPGIEVCQEL
ncbi:MAG: glycogen debranching N-terminal domain-containing protein [Thermoplasmata archaeon]